MLEVVNDEYSDAIDSVVALAGRMNSDKWAIGDALLSLERASREAGEKLPFSKLLEAHSLDTRYGLTPIALRKYKLVAEKWLPDRRVECSWAVHAELIDPANRHLIEPGMTIDGAHRKKLEWLRERSRANPAEPKPWEPEKGDPSEDTFGEKDPSDPRWSVTQKDVGYERIRFEMMMTRAASDVAEMAEYLPALVGADWPPVEWLAVVDEMKESLARVETAIQSGAKPSLKLVP